MGKRQYLSGYSLAIICSGGATVGNDIASQVFGCVAKAVAAMTNRLHTAKLAGVLVVTAGIALVTLLAAGLVANKPSQLSVVAAAVHKPALATMPGARPILGLGAERRGRDLWLTWNRESPVIKNATSGVLTIEDRRSTEEFHFSGAMIQGGAFRVSPKSEYVKASLTVPGAGTTIREWVIAVLTPNQAATPAASRSPVLPYPRKPVGRTGTEQGRATSVADSTEPTVSLETPFASDPAPVIEEPGLDARLGATEQRVIPKTIDIRVTIDDAGRVIAAEIVAQNGVDKQFADAALRLARTWEFEPAQLPGAFREETLHLQEPAYH